MTETFSLATDFPNGLLGHLLISQINNAGTLAPVTCLRVASDGDLVQIFFSAGLNPTQKLLLGAIIAVHDGTNKPILVATTTSLPNTSTTLQTTEVTDITLTLPGSTDTLIGRSTSDVLTNKTIDDTTNLVTADNLRSSTGVIDIKSSAAPTTGQVLTATSSTTATWQSPTTDIFGSQYAYVIQAAASQTTSTTFTAKATLSQELPIGTYHIGYSYEVAAALSVASEISVDFDGTNLLLQSISPLTTYQPYSGFGVVTTTSDGTKTATINFRVTVIGTLFMKNARLELWRVS